MANIDFGIYISTRRHLNQFNHLQRQKVLPESLPRKMKIKKIIYAEKFDGMPKESNFKIVEDDLGDDLKKDGQNLFFDVRCTA